MSDQNPTPAPDANGQSEPQQHQTPQYGQPPAYDPQQYPPQQQYGQYPPQQYPPQQQYPYQQQGYDPQQYGQYPPQQYEQYSPYGYQQQWPQEEPRSKTLGLVGFGIVALCTVVLAVVSYLLGGQFGQFVLDYGVEALENIDPSDQVFIGFSQQIQGLSTTGMLATFGGIAGWIVSIIATGQRRGRNFGIWGIVLGVLAPIIGIIALMVGLWPAVSVLAG